MWYDIPYEESIQKIKSLNKYITIKEYNKIAKEFGLLSSESLQYIEHKNFYRIVKSARGKIA